MAIENVLQSGTINGSIAVSGNGGKFYIDWKEGDMNTAGNQTKVWARMRFVQGNTKGDSVNSNCTANLSINGNEVFNGNGRAYFMSKNGEYTSWYGGETWEGETIITHDSDGKKEITISGEINTGTVSTYLPGKCSASSKVILTTIPRASSITATDANIGSASSIIINRASSSFTHTVTYSFAGLSGTIASKTSSTTIGWTVPESFYQKIPNDQEGTVTITCDTYSGDTKIGTKTTTMLVKVPDSAKPVIDSATAVDTNATTIALTGSNKRLVTYKSKVKLDITGRCLKYAGFSKLRERNIYEIPSTHSTSGGTTTVTGSQTYENNTLEQFKICLVDTRGKFSDYKILNQTNGDFTIVPYIPLTINAEFSRTTPTGGGVSLKFSGNFYNGYFDASKANFNTLEIKWRYKEDTSSASWSSWTSLKLNTGFKYGSGNTYFSGNGSSAQLISLGTGFNYKKKYVFELCYSDKLSSVTYSQGIKEGEPTFDYGKDSDGNNYFNVNGDIYKNNENIKQRDILTAILARNDSFNIPSKWDYVKAGNLSKLNKTGSKLSISSGKIKIGAGVTKVLVSFHCQGITGPGGDHGMRIVQNDSSEIAVSYVGGEFLKYIPLASAPKLVDVKEGDTFELQVFSGNVGTLTILQSYLTVEVVE